MSKRSLLRRNALLVAAIIGVLALAKVAERFIPCDFGIPEAMTRQIVAAAPPGWRLASTNSSSIPPYQHKGGLFGDLAKLPSPSGRELLLVGPATDIRMLDEKLPSREALDVWILPGNYDGEADPNPFLTVKVVPRLVHESRCSQIYTLPTRVDGKGAVKEEDLNNDNYWEKSREFGYWEGIGQTPITWRKYATDIARVASACG